MVNIADLKNYILEEQQIEPILEELGCHHISHKAGYYQCANPDGDNSTALCIYENENLTAVDYTRDIANGKTSYDLISVVQFFLELSFPKAIKQICEWVGLDYYHNFEEDLPKSMLILKELIAMQNEGEEHEDDRPIVPISEAILGYYKPYVNQIFADDGISYETQQEFEIGFDELTNRITIPIRDEIGTLVGVKGRYFGKPPEGELKYLYLEPCARNRILYGLYKTEPYIKNEGLVYVGEAEKSVMQMWNMDVCNCVATGGKKVSQNQIEILTRLCVDICFVFDKDVQLSELMVLANRFVDGVSVYAVVDDKGILNEKEAPTDNPEKFKALIENCVRRIK